LKYSFKVNFVWFEIVALCLLCARTNLPSKKNKLPFFGMDIANCHHKKKQEKDYTEVAEITLD